MKALIFYPLLLVVIFSVTSCQKEITGEIVNSRDSTVQSSSLVKTYTEDYTSSAGHNVDSFAMTYDSKNRLTSMVLVTSPGSKFIYAYNTDNTYTMDLYVANALSIHEIFFINSIGFIDSTFQKNSTNDSSTEKYIYDANKLLTQLKEYEYVGSTITPYNTTSYTYDNSRNIIRQKDSKSDLTFDYYSNYPNTLNRGVNHYPKSTNLIKTTIINSGAVTLNHTYTFDSKNRITSEKAVATSGEVSIRRYTY